MAVLEVTAATLETGAHAAMETAREIVVSAAKELEAVLPAGLKELPFALDGTGNALRMPSMQEFISSLQSNQLEPERLDMTALTNRIAKRLAGDPAFRAESWNSLDINGRTAMMGKALKIICDEMELPSPVREQLQLRVQDLGYNATGEKTLGGTNVFIAVDGSGKLILNPDMTPTIMLDPVQLAGPLEQSLETVFHESIHVMQKTSAVCGNPKLLEETTLEAWRKELERDCASGIPDGSYMEYWGSYIESFAHAWDDQLINVFQAACLDSARGGIKASGLNVLGIEEWAKRLETKQQLREISSWLGEINPNFDPFDISSPYCNNCGSCAYAVYCRLEGTGKPVASSVNIGYNAEMEALTGKKQIPMSPQAIEQYLLEQGSGAHAIIGIDRAYGPGHWFNAANIDGKVVAIDGQSGEIFDWPPDYGNVVNWEISI